jgi:urea carboxylase
MTKQQQSRYTWGGDEFLLVEIGEDMSLEANFTVHSIAAALEAKNHEGFVDIAPGNASLLLRFNPDLLPPAELEAMVKGLEEQFRSAAPGVVKTRVFEVPVWFDDPFTKETMKRFREGFHQTPDGDDLEYGAEVNGLS